MFAEMGKSPESTPKGLPKHYLIHREIGAGGMAVVYLAEDTRYNRKVAIKVIRPELAAIMGTDRFLTEIEVTANLQHPHILPLFDSGEADGLPFYVAPYIEGESLQDKLNREKQISIEETIAFVTAVAGALDYAHGRGVIHRDIKPANILLQDDQPVVADFGIALAVSQAGGQRLTETGLSIGTPEYMSPEQAAGDRLVDARSDQYALACVAYELLLGEPPHTGPTAQAIIAKVITDDPKPVSQARATVPSYIEFAIHRALAKTPADRFSTVGDFADAMTNPTSQHRWLGALPTLTRSRLARIWGYRAALALVGLAAVWGWMRESPKEASTAVRFEIPYPGNEGWGLARHTIAVSPKGTHLAYVAQGVGGEQQIHLRSLTVLDPSVIPGSAGAMDPFFSPDGQWLGYATVVGLMKVPVTGGVPTPILEFPEPRGATWTEDGDIIFGSYRGIFRIPAEGGTPERLTDLSSEGGDRMHARPQLLPGQKAVLFTITANQIDQTQVAALDLNTGEIRELFPGISPRYVGTGHIIYGRPDGVLMGVPFDAGNLTQAGAPVQLLSDVTVKPSGTMDFAVADNGLLVYLTGVTPNGSLVMVDRNARETTLLAEENLYVSPSFSPDGNRIAVGVGVPPTRQAWIFNLADRFISPVTFDGHNYYPVWNHDGSMIAFTNETASQADIRWAGTEGDDDPELLLATGAMNYPESFSPDGRYLVYREQDENTQRDLWSLPLFGDRTPERLFDLPSSQEESPRISPNGKWLAFSSDLSGRYEVYVTGFPIPGPRVRVSVDGGTEPVWGKQGSELFYRKESQLVSARYEGNSSFRVLNREVVFEAPYMPWPFHSNYDVHPDGNRFVFVKTTNAAIARMVVVLNWADEVQSLMPER